MDEILTIGTQLLFRLPLIFLKAYLWAWIWKKICKREKFEFIAAIALSLPPIILCVFNIAIKHMHEITVALLYNIIANCILSLLIYYLLQRNSEKRTNVNVAGRVNTEEYRQYSKIMKVPEGKIDTDRLIESYMAARKKATTKEERDQIELAYLYFTDYKEYKKIIKDRNDLKELDKTDREQERVEEPPKCENTELEKAFRRRLSGRY